MKNFLLASLLLLATLKGFSQEKNYFIEPKLNLAALGVTALNPAVEIGFGKMSAVELSGVYFMSAYNFLGTGSPFLLSMNMAEYRVYPFSENHTSFLFGGHVGYDMYKFNKNSIPIVAHGKAEDSYDWGRGVFLGVTLGYKWMFKSNFGVELSVSGGWHHADHEPYLGDGTLMVPMNKSGEWLLYKGGVYLSYRF